MKYEFSTSIAMLCSVWLVCYALLCVCCYAVWLCVCKLFCVWLSVELLVVYWYASYACMSFWGLYICVCVWFVWLCCSNTLLATSQLRFRSHNVLFVHLLA